MKKRFWFLALFFVVYFTWLIFPYPKNALVFSNRTLEIQDRYGRKLLELGGEGRNLSLSLKEVPKDLIDLLLFSEDRSFYRHHGVSIRALVRVVRNFFLKGKISGGSTLTQQLVKMRCGINRNNLWTKFLEFHRAFRMELHFSKEEILEAYLNQVFFGHRIYGFRTASRLYFRKELWQLTLLEKAALIKLLQKPSFYDPYRYHRLERAAKSFLRHYPYKTYQRENFQLAQEEHLRVFPFEGQWFAPHFAFRAADFVKKNFPKNSITKVRTSLDLDLYKLFREKALNRIHLISYNPGIQISALMIDNASGEILVYLASDFFSDSGEMDGIRIQRQPGSTMKPFIYALALEKKILTLSTVIPDLAMEFPSPVGKYIPKNYDNRFHGPVRMAVALASSYNIPAIHVLNQVGLFPAYRFLKSIGFDSLRRNPRFYGLGLVLGNADVTLYEMTRAYTLFPRGGIPISLTGVLQVYDGREWSKVGKKKRHFKSEISPETAELITHVLTDFSYKVPAFGANSPLRFPFPVAVKTGTSKNFRDNTVFAYTDRFTIGIWLGTFNGKALLQMPSSLGAGVILRDVLLELYNRDPSWFEKVRDKSPNLVWRSVCRLSGMVAGPDCPSMKEEFLRGSEPRELCQWHTKKGVCFPSAYREWAKDHYFKEERSRGVSENRLILSPRSGDTFRIDPSVSSESQAIRLTASEGGGVWFVDRERVGKGRVCIWNLKVGRHQILYRISEKRMEQIRITVVP